MFFDLNQCSIKIICEQEVCDAAVETVARENELDVFLQADADRPKFVELHWNAPAHDDILVLGDAWERSYGELEFRPLADNDRVLPCYLLQPIKKNVSVSVSKHSPMRLSASDMIQTALPLYLMSETAVAVFILTAENSVLQPLSPHTMTMGIGLKT